MDQMLTIIQYLHERDHLHHDIKPDNYCMGRGKSSNKLFMIDFGISKPFRKGIHHVPYRDGVSIGGTARYSSLNTHKCIQQGRRDDMESIGYVIIYLLRGNLPWQGLHKH